MERNNEISWIESEWNPHIGCRIVSDGCKHCHHHKTRISYNEIEYYNKVIKDSDEFQKPCRWSLGRKILTSSKSDFFIEEADSWRDEMWDIIKNTSHHTYVILTKRPERIKDNLPKDWSLENYKNVWLGISVESQEHVNRIHYLREIDCDVKWVSFEPLVSEIYLSENELSTIDWAVIGGEKGAFSPRKMELSWAMSLMYQFNFCQTPIFFKQFGTWYQKNQLHLADWKGEKYCTNFPEIFKLRQYPIIKQDI